MTEKERILQLEKALQMAIKAMSGWQDHYGWRTYYIHNVNDFFEKVNYKLRKVLNNEPR